MEKENFSKIAQQSIDKDLFSLLVASIKDYAIFIVDLQGRIVSWNIGAERMSGYCEDEITGRHLSVLYITSDVVTGEPAYQLQDAMRNGRHESDGQRIRKDGTRFWTNLTVTPIQNSNEQHIGFAMVMRDVTQSKNSADRQEIIQAGLAKRVKTQSERIISNQLRFKKLIEHSYDGISLLDENFRVFYRSLSAERISGWNNEERLRTDMADLVHPDDAEAVFSLLPDVLAEPYEPQLINFRSRHRNGHYIWLECMFTNMLQDEDIRAIVCNFRDITSRVQAQQEVNQKAQQIENILDRITDGFIALDNNLCYTYANKQVGEMLGVAPETLIGKHIWDVFPDAVGSKTYRAIMRSHKNQHYVHNEDFYEPLHLWQENNIYPSPEGLSIFIRDISERKLTEHQLLSHNKLMKEAADMQNAVLNALPPHITLLDEHGIILNVNDSWKRFSLANHLHVPDFGIGSSYYSVCDKISGIGKESKNIIRGIKAVLSGKKNEYIREYSCHTATEKRWFQLVAAPLTNQKRKGAVVLHINITARKLAEESLLKTRANLSSVFENTDLSIVLFDTDLKIVAYNNNARELSVLYFHRKMRVGSSAFKYFPPERKASIKHFTDRARNGEKVSYEVNYDFNGQPTKWFEVTWVNITDSNQQTVGIILTIKNITDRKRQENKITLQNDALREVAWLSSHEIRRPVASILGLINLFKLTPDRNERDEMVNLIDVCANELDDMVHQIHYKIQTDVSG